MRIAATTFFAALAILASPANASPAANTGPDTEAATNSEDEAEADWDRIEQMRERTLELAFDPFRYFSDAYVEPLITIRYTGDDYGYPVYSIALRRGCSDEDVGEARKNCWERLVARMVRSPDPAPEGERPTRRRWRGAAVYDHIAENDPANDAELREVIDAYGLEWMEADVTQCQPALDHMKTADDIPFFADPIVPDGGAISIVLHADKIDFEFGGYITRSRYIGFAKEGSPGEWADNLASALESCWQPASATKPWLLDDTTKAEE